MGSNETFLDDDKIIKGPKLVFPYTTGIGPTLFEKLKDSKKKIAQIDTATGEKDTFETFTRRCIRTALTMRSKGITSDDIITVCSNNHLNTCVPIIASYFLDVKMAHTDPRLSLSDTTYLLNQVRPKMIFVSTNAVKLIEDAVQEIDLKSEIIVFDETANHTPFSDFLNENKEEHNFKPVDVNDLSKTACIFFSSGTTGYPKGICLNHKTLLAQTLLSAKISHEEGSVILSTSPPYWISLTSILLSSIINGACRLVISDMSTDTMWHLLEKYKVTILVLTPMSVAKMCQSKRPANINIPSLRALFFGGSTFSKETMEAARNILPTALVLTAYGQTEVGGLVTLFQFNVEDDLNMYKEKITSSGQVGSGYSIKVVDVETGKSLGPNESGEIRIKTEYQMNGYYNLDSSDQWGEDGFLKTGDLGYYDEDKFFYVIDRLKEMFKYQGWQIAPAKLESVLLTHSAVETAMVIGIPHPVDNEHPMGVVVLKKTHLNVVTAEDIKQYVDNQVDDKYKLRAGVKIVKELVQTPSEKFKRKYIKDLILAGKL